MINKNLDDISYKDIQFLEEHKIEESDTLDYKSEMMEDSKLMKQVCAFANTRGGDIIFGIKESGDGGHPSKISGLDNTDLNKERIEQVILSNIVPRLDVKIKAIPMPNQTHSILLLRIPDSYLKPHQNNMNKKFYKRFQFKSEEMTEQEICDCYKKRFTNNDQVEQYIEKTLNDEIRGNKTTITRKDIIKTNVIVIPSNIQHRLIETSNSKVLEWFESIKNNSKTGNAYSSECVPFELKPFSQGLISYANESEHRFRQTSIHRNGCIHFIQYFMDKESTKTFRHTVFEKGLMCLLQFASQTLQHYNYFGEVRIIVRITCPVSNSLNVEGSFNKSLCTIDKIDCKIEREYPLQYVKSDYNKLISSIMGEIFNHYHHFDDDLKHGRMTENNFR